MADRYWVGGTGVWDATAGSKWSTTSGGGGGASVPTAADSVFFDQSGAYTVTMTGALTCLDFNTTNGPVTFTAGTTPTLAISGSLTFVAGTVMGVSIPTTFNATTTGKTITTNGVNYASSMTFNGVGGEWTLGGARAGSTITVSAGTFNTANYNVSSVTFVVSGASTKVINFGSSTVTLSGNINFSGSNFTFNAGTSQINLTATSPAIETATSVTYNNVACTNAGAGTKLLIGSNTFNTFSVGGTTPTLNITSGTTQTVTTFDFNGTAGNVKTIKSTVAGSRATLSKASGTVTCDYVSIQDSAATGGATWNATNATDAGNNIGWIINGVPSGLSTGNFFFVM